jgi:hypothetical protein
MFGLALSACTSDDVLMDLQNGNAVFEGTFIRSSPTAKYMAADVTLVLENDTFRGMSSEDRYPAICQGTYSINESIITFHDECFWTADFDWTLILSGEWHAGITDDNVLILTRHQAGITDRYELRKKE